jgi:hypothetical protein
MMQISKFKCFSKLAYYCYAGSVQLLDGDWHRIYVWLVQRLVGDTQNLCLISKKVGSWLTSLKTVRS